METLVSDRIKLSRVFKKQASGVITDTTKAKAVKSNQPARTIDPELAKAMAMAEEAKAGYEAFEKQIKLKEQQLQVNQLKTRQLKLDDEIQGTEQVMLQARYSDDKNSEAYRKAESTRKDLMAKKSALNKEMRELGYGEIITGNANLTSQPDKLYYVRCGDYYFFLRDETVWIRTPSDNRWAWLFVPMLNRLSNEEEYKLLIEKKYNLVELKQRFTFHFPTRWDLGSPFDSDEQNNDKAYKYNHMKIDLSKATILY